MFALTATFHFKTEGERETFATHRVYCTSYPHCVSPGDILATQRQCGTPANLMLELSDYDRILLRSPRHGSTVSDASLPLSVMFPYQSGSHRTEANTTISGGISGSRFLLYLTYKLLSIIRGMSALGSQISLPLVFYSFDFAVQCMMRYTHDFAKGRSSTKTTHFLTNDIKWTYCIRSQRPVPYRCSGK